MTLQEIFDKCADHLLTQMAKSVTVDLDKNKRYCAYRGENGRKCAAGIFIADKQYSPSLEGNIVSSEQVSKALLDSGFPINETKFYRLINRLQQLHDCYPENAWKDVLTIIAEEYKLNDHILEKFP